MRKTSMPRGEKYMVLSAQRQAGISGVVGGFLWAVGPLRQPIFDAGRTPDEGETFFRIYNFVLIAIAILLTIAGKSKGSASTGHGDRYLARVLGEAAVMAGRSDTFLGERYRRIARRRGKKKAIVAVGRSMLVIIWHLLSDSDARFRDLGADHFTRDISTEARKRNHIRQLEALGYRVTLESAA
jgi:hypothetical protein